MKFFVSLFLVILCWFKGYSQTYDFKYIIVVDTSFSNVKNGMTDMENQIQSFALKSFMDSTIIKGTTTKDTAVIEYIPKFLSQNNVNPGYRIGDKKNGITLDSAAFDNQRILDKKNNKSITLKPHSKIKATCQSEEKGYLFVKTKETKMIKNWLCYKWIPKDKSISNEVSAWVCDLIPAAINFDFVSNQFTGGLVSLDFNRGFAYQLIDYNKAKDLQVPIINQCDSTITTNSNFVKHMIFDHIGLDFKTSF